MHLRGSTVAVEKANPSVERPISAVPFVSAHLLARLLPENIKFVANFELGLTRDIFEPFAA